MSNASASLVNDGITAKLCAWAFNLELEQIPGDVQARAKHIVLDGVGCAMVGAHLPWSEVAAKAIFDLEAPGDCSIIGWDRKLSGSAAALLNSTLIQSFELDDYHSRAPLHSAALLLPALFAAVEHVHSCSPEGPPISGKAFLIAAIVGLEIGPRIGLGLGGGKMLSRGWHSGAIFGGPAVALAVSKLLGLSQLQMEWALGTACTQAGGLMSAQYESMVKRMQHGFASRNGFLAAFLSRANYTGIEDVLERQYGGFLAVFSQGSKDDLHQNGEAIITALGDTWEINNICIKPYAAMAGLHASIDCIRSLQKTHADRLGNPQAIQYVQIEMGDEAFKHGGWEVQQRPLTVVGAQMNAKYVVAAQLVDGEILPSSYGPVKINRDVLYELIDKTTCLHQSDFDASYKTRVTIRLHGEQPKELTETVELPRGSKPPLSNDEIREKYEALLSRLVDQERRTKLRDMVTGLERVAAMESVIAELRGNVKSALI